MEEADLKKLMEPDFTVSLRPARAPLMIIDEAGIDEDEELGSGVRLRKTEEQ